MVEPMSREERDSGNRKIQLAVLALVTISPPLIMLQGEPTTGMLAAATAGGFLFGLVVVWYLRRLGQEFNPNAGRAGRRGR